MAESTPNPPRRWRDWLLIASLGLNLAVLGLVVGAALRGPPERPIAGPSFGHYARALPDPYRQEIGQALRRSRGDWGPTRDALRDQRRALAAALTAEPYDPARVAGLLAEEMRLASELGDRGAELLLAQIARMSPADRAAFAARLLEDRPNRRASRDRGRGPDRDQNPDRDDD